MSNKKKEDLTAVETFTAVLPELVKNYHTEAIWLPATSQVLKLLEDKDNVAMLKTVGITRLVRVQHPTQSPLFNATARCDDQLRLHRADYDSLAKLEGVVEDMKFPFVCLQVQNQTKYGVLETRVVSLLGTK